MKRRLQTVRRDAALRDLESQAEFIALDQPAAAIRLIRQFEIVAHQLQHTPLLGRAYRPRSRRLKGIRMIPIPGFRGYLVFYRVTEDAIEILRLLHASQDYLRILRELQ